MAWVKFNVKLVKDGTSDLSTHLFDYFVSNHNVPPPLHLLRNLHLSPYFRSEFPSGKAQIVSARVVKCTQVFLIVHVICYHSP